MFGESGWMKTWQKSLLNEYISQRLSIVTTNLNGFSLVNS